MFPQLRPSPDVFTAREIADVAGVSAADVRALLEFADDAPAGRRFFGFADAVRLVTALREMRQGAVHPRRIFAPPARQGRGGNGIPLAASGALHAGFFAILMLLAGLGLRSESAPAPIRDSARLVFLASPGPGGGGGGGGLKDPRRAPPAKVRGTSQLQSPVTVTKTTDQRDAERRIEPPTPPAPEPVPNPEPPPPQPQPTPPVVAPVVTAPSDAIDRVGVLTDGPPAAPSQGSGEDGGTGTGRGTGSGEGDGAGIGEGSIAGIGGGPYRPGAGITPPALLREVKPVYTNNGRRRGVEGEVLLEVVVRADGTVGPIRIVRGLGSGLDERAIEAVRQWRFSPARRHGSPVDVLVEVAVDFRIR